MKQAFRKLFLFTLLALIGFGAASTVNAQTSISKAKHNYVYVDSNGVMRWQDGDKEVQGFGVNYSAPFAHAYRSAQKLGVNIKKAMQADVYHFSRLGFNLFRMHIWDTQISDEKGNILKNEQLDHFDYLVKLLKDQDIKMVLTPIAFWGDGWPEPDSDTPGFSSKYGKDGSLTNSRAIKAQQRYLSEFLSHVNPYTGLAYKDDPDVIAFEVSNEPHHREKPEAVTRFISGMVDAMKSTGTKKPIFYNISHSVHLAQEYFDAGIDGGTFQWYPTGLLYGQELEGNLLPNVSKYHIPFESVIRKNGGAKLVYEFDAADVMKSYMYPAMARSFREAGIQIATQFAYDPMFLSYANTEYNTHYMNLAYTPRKALSLMITSKVFHEVPLYEDQGAYSAETSFGNFHLSYEKDLALYNGPDTFIYTNHTDIKPVSPKELRHIAGYGNAPIVKYEGTGAYFLDKLEEGVWRMELMPDVVHIQNPFGTNSLKKKLAVIKHQKWDMQVQLPDLGQDFQVVNLDRVNELKNSASSNSFEITPGVYLLIKKGKPTKASYPGWDDKRLSKFIAPTTDVEHTWLMHRAYPEISADSKPVLQAEVVSKESIKKVEAWFKNGNTYTTQQFEQVQGYTYQASIPQEVLHQGYLEYRIIVTTQTGSRTYPSGKAGNPGEWDYEEEAPYISAVVEADNPIYLFEALKDAAKVVGQWKPNNRLSPTSNPALPEYRVELKELFAEDPENLDAEPIFDYSFRSYFADKTAAREQDLEGKTHLVLKARSLVEESRLLQVAIVLKDGSSFGTIVDLAPEMMEYKMALSELKPVATVTLPRPYPTFLPYYLNHNLKSNFDLSQAESLQFSIGPGLTTEQKKQAQGVGIISVHLE